MDGNRMNKWNKNIVAVLFTPLFLLLIVYPLIALLARLEWIGTLKTFADIYFWLSVRNTLFAGLLAALLSLVLAVGFGYCHLFLRHTLIYKVANLMNDLPIALPHTVAGLTLLIAFGRKNCGFIGETGLAFTLVAVVLAMFFVSYPLAARTVASGMDKMETEMIDVARTLGDTPVKAYFRVVLPTLGEALFSGFVLAFSRSLSEFAAVVMFGGNLPGSTQVLASYVFTKVEEGELEMAVTASAFCIFLSLLIVAALSLRRRVWHAKG
jgi:molybdate transport system permease protein